MELGINGKVALVTGASAGIGKAVALGLAQAGCRVCIVARTEEKLNAAACEIRGATGAEVVAVAGDVAEPAALDVVLRETRAQLGPIDILVNNAGGPPPGGFLEHDESVWVQTIQRNFLSVVRLSRAVAPAMIEKKWGRILCLTSTIAKEPSPVMVLSASARAAVSAFTKAIAAELAPHNITVNTICPGGVDTERVSILMTAAARREGRALEDIVERSVASIPARRFARTEEIASVMTFLASERASYVTGTSIMVDGGLTKGIF